MSKKYFTMTPAVYLILQKDDRFLFLQRKNTGFQDGNYSLPAGHVDGNERLVDSMIREAKEEIGMDLFEEDLKLVHVMHRNYQIDHPEDERLDFYFIAKKWNGEIENCEPHKCSDLSWFSLEDAPNNVIPYIRQAVQCAVHNIVLSDEDFDSKELIR